MTARTKQFPDAMRTQAIFLQIDKAYSATEAANQLAQDYPGRRTPSARWCRSVAQHERDRMRAGWAWDDIPAEDRDDPECCYADAPDEWRLSMSRRLRDNPELGRGHAARFLRSGRTFEALTEAGIAGSDLLFLAHTAEDLATVARYAAESTGRPAAELLIEALALVKQGGES